MGCLCRCGPGAEARRQREGAGSRLGYYYPTARFDVAAATGPAIPILGDILRYTLAPLLGRIVWPALMRKIFGPAEVPQKFTEGFPAALALRPLSSAPARREP